MKALGSIDTLLPRTSALLTQLRLAALAAVAGALLAGCGAGSVQTAANPVTPPTSSGQSYSGPAPASGDGECGQAQPRQQRRRTRDEGID